VPESVIFNAYGGGELENNGIDLYIERENNARRTFF
jgi:hypothetical protein